MEIHSVQQINEWFVNYISQLFNMSPTEVDTQTPLESYGLDSTGAAGLITDLGAWLGLKMDQNLLYNYPTIDVVSQHLFEKYTSDNQS